MVSALATIDQWPVEHATAAVVDSAGTDDAHGDIDMEFELASVTKLLTAYATLIAVEEGSVTLDQPAGPRDATLRHLLAHASGLPFEGTTPIARVGARRIYSNVGFELVAATVAGATGLPFATYLDEA